MLISVLRIQELVGGLVNVVLGAGSLADVDPGVGWQSC